MNNGVMMAAMAEIDDTLITDAEEASRKKKSLKPLYAVCSLAACLVLAFTFMFTLQKSHDNPRLFVNGTEISQKPFQVDVPMVARNREYSSDITIPLTIEVNDDTRIRVSYGTMDICSPQDTNEIYYSGTEYKTDRPVNIQWHLDGSDINSVYTLTLNEDVVYTLLYDNNTALWSICKQ